MQVNKQSSQLLQHQKLSPKQLQFLHLLRYNTFELDQYIIDEAYTNPYIDVTYTAPEIESKPIEKSGSAEGEIDEQTIAFKEYYEGDALHTYIQSNKDDGNFQFLINNYHVDVDTIDWVKNQLGYHFKNQDDLFVANYILDTLDDHGFLIESIEDITDELSFRNNKLYDEGTIGRIVETIKDIESIGLGCHDIKEYFIFQINNSKVSDKATANIAIDLITNGLVSGSSFSKERFCDTFHYDERQYQSAIDFIKSLRVSPISEVETLSDSAALQVDYIVEMDLDGEVIGFAAKNYIDAKFNEGAIQLSQQDKSSEKYIKDLKSKANETLELLSQRSTTLENVIRAIVIIQNTYFKSGNPSDIVAMSLKDLSMMTGYDTSTLSRSTSNKYIQTPFGTISAKSLFIGKIITTAGLELTPQQVKEKIKSMIQEEDPLAPYSDAEISEKLYDEYGIELNRRSITNYRKDLGISNSENRKSNPHV